MTRNGPADTTRDDRARFGIERRRAARRTLQAPLPVRDVVSGQGIGQIANLSQLGMLVATSQVIPEGMLMQLSFSLPDASGRLRPIHVGVQQQWMQPGTQCGWAGLGIIDISPEDAALLSEWLAGRV